MIQKTLITSRIILAFISITLIVSCKQEKASLILYHGNILTMDSIVQQVQAIACKDDKIIAIGTSENITQKYYHKDCETIDLQGKFAMPGFIEGHGHFNSMGKSLSQLNLLHTESWYEILDSIKAMVHRTPKGEWIYGRGWHQEKWSDSLLQTHGGYPVHNELSALSPDNPVILIHASGHALMRNQIGMNHLNKDIADPQGGHILRDQQGEMSGIFEENAMSLIQNRYNDFLNTISNERRDSLDLIAFQNAQNECLVHGITSFQDAGSSFEEIDQFMAYDRRGLFDVRLSVMIYESLHKMRAKLANITRKKSTHFKVNAIKSYADGALGSYGALLLKPYDDKPDQIGQQLIPLDSLQEIALLASKNNLQLCVHGIGDSSNRQILDLVERLISKNQLKSDHRWRIEHAQHIDPKDIGRFKELGVVASIQAIHCTSDAPFVEKRLGEERAKNGAYVWRSLLDSGAQLANGTDVPVEKIDPFTNLYAAVTRKASPDIDAFYPEQAMTRLEALKSYTVWNAFANFEEANKGSLIPGKVADIIVLSNDLTKCTDEEILETEVFYTIIGGKIKYQKKD